MRIRALEKEAAYFQERLEPISIAALRLAHDATSDRVHEPIWELIRGDGAASPTQSEFDHRIVQAVGKSVFWASAAVWAWPYLIHDEAARFYGGWGEYFSLDGVLSTGGLDGVELFGFWPEIRTAAPGVLCELCPPDSKLDARYEALDWSRRVGPFGSGGGDVLPPKKVCRLHMGVLARLLIDPPRGAGSNV